ncbi:MAG: hypothetical protein Kow0068_03320 [Marinilabiliales bacterium]
MSQPKVNILVPAYNHEKFIHDAIISVLNQKTEYSFEIIAGDDASTDNTAKILKELANKHKNKIKLVLQNKNTGVFNLVKDMYSLVNSEYIAVLDGDDKWIYDRKLQEQISFLEENKEFSASFHDAIIENKISETELNNRIIREQAKTNYKYYSEKFGYTENYTVKDLILRKNIPSSSFVFRNTDLQFIFNKYDNINLTFGWLIQLYIYKTGKFKYFPEAWSMYNDHSGGLTKKIGFNKFNKTNIRILHELLNDSFYKKYKKYIYRSISNQYKYMYFSKFEKNKLKNLRNYFFYYFKSLIIKNNND